MVSVWWAISQQAGRVVSSEAPSSPLPTLLPLLPQSTRRAHEIVARPLLILHLSFCFSCSHIRWRHWRKRIRAPASSGWVCGRTSLPAHSYRMEGEGEPSVQSVQSHIRTRWLDKRLQRYNLWLCSRSFRPRCSPMRKPVWMQLHSGTWGAWQTWFYMPPKPPPRPSGVRCPAW